jgi:hypothetical protein
LKVALREIQVMEAAAQLEILAQRSQAAIRQSEQQLEFALRAGRHGGRQTILQRTLRPTRHTSS